MAHELATDPPFGGIGRSIGRGEALLKGYFNFFPSETWNPPVNLYESETSYLVCVDLAGVEKDKIDLTVQENKLRLKGTRPVPAPPTPPATAVESEQAKKRLHLMEIDHGAFMREVELPDDVAADQIQASYDCGMLWVELPKRRS